MHLLSNGISPHITGGPSWGPTWAMAPPAKLQILYYPLVLPWTATYEAHFNPCLAEPAIRATRRASSRLFAPRSSISPRPLIPGLAGRRPVGDGGWPVVRWGSCYLRPQLISVWSPTPCELSTEQQLAAELDVPGARGLVW
jgi:hypothetical protein